MLAFEVAHREWLLYTEFGRTVSVLKPGSPTRRPTPPASRLLVTHEIGGTDLGRRLDALIEDRVVDAGPRDHASRPAGLPMSLPIDFRWQASAGGVAAGIARIVCRAQRLGAELPAPCQGEGRGFESRRPLH
jgi:hypothetical protein